ncbi:hypothetical protein K431DRAFT_325294 [Polychaeton citri CBS 116435]|uniref:F-box domain-containing protein n=1 Tax=Polychaeton citri CBS 116435 TaxID=1314669 RepID=A0A9P4PZ60_9PEZI|nr:hypothetical protein K431DRAFT_325294 [Polychaeton citri CBS 116435]
MSLLDSPLELVDNTISFITLADTKLAPLKITSNDLDNFKAFVTHSHPYHRAALRTLDFTIVLPTYDNKACSRFEREEDRLANNEAFSKAVTRLFDALESCEHVDKPWPIALCFGCIYSPMDRKQRYPEEYRADYTACELSQRHDLWENRYEHSNLQLLQPVKLPSLSRVVCFSIFAHVGRYVEPATVASIIASLPNLESTTWHLTDGERKFANLRTQLRQELGQSLPPLCCADLKTLNLECQHEPPWKESFKECRSSALACESSCRIDRILRKPLWMDLFTLDVNSSSLADWLKLGELSLLFSQVRLDGGWYFERDPSVPRPNDSDESDSDMEDFPSNEESSSDYDDNESFFFLEANGNTTGYLRSL